MKISSTGIHVIHPTEIELAIDRAPSDRQSTVFGVGSLSRPSDGRQRWSEYRLLAYQLKSTS
ncbi:hypothetical protein CROQUDRAFT_95617 [Cronartium quercuum f. sp. fusiforme G11]|uniref:Uncharacterized protein n=1 Tax=Cronartium quercuum f. sp. fusiforme G11 TaxID=708437 RepID=A0A9P6T9B1_9BASI|nr:hypothetical protein CROQUDRAFT_95617 [Cronartium quercuum f. sp. fusiforme G11]